MEVSSTRKRQRRLRTKPVTITTTNSLFEQLWVRLLCLCCGVLVTVFVIYSSVQSSRAHAYFQTAKNGVVNFSRGDFSQQTQIINAAKQAIAIYPNKANYHDTLASLYEYLAISVINQQHKDKDSVMIQRQWLALAYSHYQTAAMWRPYWPVTHANMAMIKWRQNQIDEVLLAHLLRAHQLGAMKDEVHQLMVNIGSAFYLSQHPYFAEHQSLFVSHFANGLRNGSTRRYVKEHIRNMSLQSDVCAWLEQDETIQRLLKCVTESE